MIINTGQRTDIPAFYSEWFINRIKEGYVLVKNPYNEGRITRYELNPDVVDCLSFCTKNPAPMLPFMDIISSFKQYWFVTVTPYGKEIEPNVPDREKVMEDFIKLSEIVGINNICWRYDPIFINGNYSLEKHIEDFRYMASKLSAYTNVCVISFIDIYEKVKRNFPEAREVTQKERLTIGKEFSETGRKYNIKIKCCAEGRELEKFGIDCGGCQTVKTFEEAIGCKLEPPKNLKPARAECTCILSADIGAYDTCGHFCRYCYANTNRKNVLHNMKKYDPKSPLLCGTVSPDDKIYPAHQESWKSEQIGWLID